MESYELAEKVKRVMLSVSSREQFIVADKYFELAKKQLTGNAYSLAYSGWREVFHKYG